MLAYLHGGVEDLATNLCKALLTEREAGLDELDVRSLVQRVLYNLLILLYGDGTGGVDDVTASFAVVVYRVNSSEDQLLLQVR